MRSFCIAKASHNFFNIKYWHISDTNIQNFNEMVTNHVISFEKPDPEAHLVFSLAVFEKIIKMLS